MGVASAGKTRLGKKLAKDTGWTFYDADDYHSDANKEKMRQGIGLNDRDRKPWLASLRHLLAGVIKRREHAVLACSALKQSYRTALTPPNVRAGAVRFVYLSVPRSVLEKRLEKRVEKHKNTFAGPRSSTVNSPRSRSRSTRYGSTERATDRRWWTRSATRSICRSRVRRVSSGQFTQAGPPRPPPAPPRPPVGSGVGCVERGQTLSDGSRSGKRQCGSSTILSILRAPKSSTASNVLLPLNHTSTG